MREGLKRERERSLHCCRRLEYRENGEIEVNNEIKSIDYVRWRKREQIEGFKMEGNEL